MSAGRRIGIGAMIAAPLVLGGPIAGAFALAGERRMLQISLALPAVFVIAGLAVSAVLGGIVLRRSARARRAARDEELRSQGVAAERENHRRFLARLDHELKNPLTAIRATAAAAGTDTPEWATVDDQARRLSILVRDLRKLAELETRPLEREQVVLESLLQEAITAIAQQDPDAGRRIRLDATRVPWPVPPVLADLDLLSLVIDNLLGNAAKYSQHGPIEVRLREESGWAVIEVADSGRGIPASDLPAVFDELARAANARDVAGSGLGLTLVATVVARHGGHVSLRSVEGSGSVATVRIPIRSA
ncbi:sensor histidine kinase [Microbacterium sp. NPDC055903]